MEKYRVIAIVVIPAILVTLILGLFLDGSQSCELPISDSLPDCQRALILKRMLKLWAIIPNSSSDKAGVKVEYVRFFFNGVKGEIGYHFPIPMNNEFMRNIYVFPLDATFSHFEERGY